jgi:outer membrane autotransporter protein
MTASGSTGRRAKRIYYFDIVHDYPAIGGVVEFSQVLLAQLRRRYGERLVLASQALRRFGLGDPAGAYLERERHIAQALAARDPDAIFFFPNFHSPIERPASGPRPIVINVVHDVQFAHLPELFSGAQLGWLHAAFAAARANADEIIFASRTTQEQYIACFGAPRHHQVIYHPVPGNELASPAAGRARPARDACPNGLSSAFGAGACVPENMFSGVVDATEIVPFLLTATHSEHHPHKNMNGLLRLFAALAPRSPDLHLYVTGHGREAFMQTLRATLPAALQGRVRHLGYVPRSTLQRLYTQARAYISLSRFEGFNMPAAEAASLGAPLILSDLPVHRELYGTQACLLDAQAPDAEAAVRFLARVESEGRSAWSRREVWPYRERCTPRQVGDAYAGAIRACQARRGVCKVPARPGSWNAGYAKTLSLHALARVLREAFTAGVVLSGAAAVALPLPAWAGGGAGGISGYLHLDTDGMGGGAGGAGGSGYAGQHGQDGQVGLFAGMGYYGGGGGGGAAGGGAGGAGGVGIVSTGGHGGNGGANGDGTTLAGSGEDGGAGVGPSGGGGGGGAGGYGLIVTGASTHINAGTLQGGAGGNGGDSAGIWDREVGGAGGSGGDGGAGMLLEDSSVMLSNTGSILGGAGGGGGNSLVAIDGMTRVGGSGGAGGHGLLGSNLTLVNSGTIAGGAGAAGGSGVTAGGMGVGGEGIIGSNLNIINSGTISGGLGGDGVTRADAIRFTGGTNALELDAGSTIIGTVDATAGSSNTLILGGAANASFDVSLLGAQYLGFNALKKAGTGNWTLNNATMPRMAWTVDAGTLAVGDADHPSAQTQGEVQVNAAGTLRGHGSIIGNVNNSGTVWPGGSIGTLTIGGNYTQSPGGTLQMEVSPTAASQLKVGGTATLAGTLSLLYAPGTYTTKTYTVVSAGSVNGSFSKVTGNTPSGFAQSVAYARNEVDLSLAPALVSPAQATIFGAVGSSALHAGQGSNEVLLERLVGPCGVAAVGASSRAAAGGGAMDASAASSTAFAQSLSCPRQGNGLWIQAQGTDTRIDGNNGAPDARDRRYGFLTGVDHQWKGWTVGVAGGYSHADVTESGNGSKGTLDTLRIAGYGAKNFGAYTLAGTLGYAYDFSSTTRSFGALGSARGDGHGQEFTAGLQASRAWSLGPVVLTPRVGVRYAYLDGLSTNETGPTAQNLGVGSQRLQSLQPYVGVTLDYPFTLRGNDRPASIQLRAGYAYETQSTGRDVSVTAADGTGFVIAGTRDTRGLVTAGLGATLPIGKSASAYVRYDSVLHTGNVNAQSLQAGVDYRF